MIYAAGLVFLLVLAGWAANAAARSGRSWYRWSRLVFFSSGLGFLAWLVVRRRAPVAVERIDGQAMAPTVEHQQPVIINKLVYRRTQPRRGDVVVFHYPLNPERTLVRRAIAEEGDPVQIRDGRRQ